MNFTKIDNSIIFKQNSFVLKTIGYSLRLGLELIKNAIEFYKHSKAAYN